MEKYYPIYCLKLTAKVRSYLYQNTSCSDKTCSQFVQSGTDIPREHIAYRYSFAFGLDILPSNLFQNQFKNHLFVCTIIFLLEKYAN